MEWNPKEIVVEVESFLDDLFSKTASDPKPENTQNLNSGIVTPVNKAPSKKHLLSELGLAGMVDLISKGNLGPVSSILKYYLDTYNHTPIYYEPTFCRLFAEETYLALSETMYQATGGKVGYRPVKVTANFDDPISYYMWYQGNNSPAQISTPGVHRIGRTFVVSDSYIMAADGLINHANELTGYHLMLQRLNGVGNRDDRDIGAILFIDASEVDGNWNKAFLFEETPSTWSIRRPEDIVNVRAGLLSGLHGGNSATPEPLV